MKPLFRKTILFAIIAALGMASLPFVSVSAAGEYDSTPPPQGRFSNERLEYIWARQRLTYERIGLGFEYEDAFIERVQSLIDRAKDNVRDVSAVQDALDAFEAAVKDAHPIYESANGIVESHQGFDENGKVTDSEKAWETVQAMRAKFSEIKNAMGGTGKALREAIKTFREAHPRPQPTSTPASS